MKGVLISKQALNRFEPLVSGSGSLVNAPWRVLSYEEQKEFTVEDISQVEVAYLSSDILGTSSNQSPTPTMARFLELLLKARALKWLQVPSAGVDRPVYQQLIKRGVCITTAHGLTSGTVALTALTGLLALSRHMPLWIKGKDSRQWLSLRSGPEEPLELSGQHVLIIGMGHIGTEFARLAKAVGLVTHGMRRRHSGPPEEHFDTVNSIDKLKALVPQMDWIVVACPLTPETRYLIDRDALSRLKPGARLINIARGEIVVESELILALQTGTLAGAYLDVFETEPLPARSPLWSMDNVILSPHSAGDSTGRHARIDQRFLDNLRRYCGGLPLQYKAT